MENISENHHQNSILKNNDYTNISEYTYQKDVIMSFEYPFGLFLGCFNLALL